MKGDPYYRCTPRPEGDGSLGDVVVCFLAFVALIVIITVLSHSC